MPLAPSADGDLARSPKLMPSKQDPKLCFRCDAPATTREHVPPRAVFPDPKPADLITVPACRACNKSTELDDEYFRFVVVSITDDHEDALSIAKDRIAARAREKPAFLIEQMRKFIVTDTFSEGGIYLRKRHALTLDRPRLQGVIDKIARGLYLHQTGDRLPQSSHDVSDFLLQPSLTEPQHLQIQALPLHDVGERGTFSYRYVANVETGESYWFLMFFDQILFFVRTEAK